MTDSLDDKANGKEPKIDAESLKEEDLIKNHLKMALDIQPDLGSDMHGKDPKTSSP